MEPQIQLAGCRGIIISSRCLHSTVYFPDNISYREWTGLLGVSAHIIALLLIANAVEQTINCEVVMQLMHRSIVVQFVILSGYISAC